METIKRVISREDIISRNQVSYGLINKEFIYVNFMLIQDIDNMGIFTDTSFIESITTNISKDDVLKGLRGNYDIKSWFRTGEIITGRTNSKLNDLKGYKEIDRYKLNFDINKEKYQDFSNKSIDGVTRITDIGDTVDYVVDANNDGFLGTESQETGLLYRDGISVIDTILNDLPNNLGDTQLQYKAQGVNDTNSSLSAITKEEYLFGIISKPEIKNDVFIDRGQNTVFEHHLRMSEIETLDHLVNYGNGYYNVTK